MSTGIPIFFSVARHSWVLVSDSRNHSPLTVRLHKHTDHCNIAKVSHFVLVPLWLTHFVLACRGTFQSTCLTFSVCLPWYSAFYAAYFYSYNALETLFWCRLTQLLGGVGVGMLTPCHLHFFRGTEQRHLLDQEVGPRRNRLLK